MRRSDGSVLDNLLALLREASSYTEDLDQQMAHQTRISEFLGSLPQRDVQHAVMEALRRIGQSSDADEIEPLLHAVDVMSGAGLGGAVLDAMQPLITVKPLRRRLTRVLLKLEDHRAADLLLEVLDFRDLGTAMDVLVRLAEWRVPRIVDLVRTHALPHPDPWARRVACHALTTVGSPAAGVLLRDLARSDPDDFVRATAAYGLVQLGDEGAWATLQAILDGGPPPASRYVMEKMLFHGRAEALDGALRRVPDLDAEGQWLWLMELRIHVPQLPYPAPDLPPPGEEQARTALAWLREHRDLLVWQPASYAFRVPGVPDWTTA